MSIFAPHRPKVYYACPSVSDVENEDLVKALELETKVLRFGAYFDCFVFEFWCFDFELGCFVFHFSVLCFRVLGDFVKTTVFTSVYF